MPAVISLYLTCLGMVDRVILVRYLIEILHLCASYVILVEKCVMRCGRCDSFRIGAFASATASNYLLTYFLSLIIFVSLLLIRTVRAADRIALSFLQEHFRIPTV